jgi:hypothetical protein
VWSDVPGIALGHGVGSEHLSGRWGFDRMVGEVEGDVEALGFLFEPDDVSVVA